jgi:MFS family permease
MIMTFEKFSKEQYKLIFLSGSGGALEFFDFTIYAFFANYISQAFFPSQNHFVSLLNTFAVFAVGYFARPLGGIFFGHLGDKYGRKRAFTLSTFIMAFATVLIGLLPTYRQVGTFAPLLLLLLRLIQGFSVGGELPGSTVFIVEHLHRHRRGFSVGLVFMCVTLGNVLAGLVGLSLTSWLNPHEMQQWGWRVPFAIGFLLGVVSYVLRRRAVESPLFKILEKEKKLHRLPLLEVVKVSAPQLIVSFLLVTFIGSMFIMFLYLPVYLSTILHYPIRHVYLNNTIAFLVLAIGTAVFGYLSDYLGRKRLIIIGTILFVVIDYFLFRMLVEHLPHAVELFTIDTALLASLPNGCYACMIAELFPTNLRYSGMGISYNFGLAVFTGLGPLFITYLLKVTMDMMSPYYYLAISALITLIAAVIATRWQDHLKIMR